MEEKTLSDIGVVAYLVTQGIRPAGNSRKSFSFHFRFENTPQLEDEILKYYSHNASVDPLAYIEAFRSLTAQVRELKSLGR